MTVELASVATAKVRVAKSLVTIVSHVGTVALRVGDSTIVFIHLDAAASLALEVDSLVEGVVLGIGLNNILVATGDSLDVGVASSATACVLISLSLTTLVELVSSSRNGVGII